ncbi:glutathione S-transferase family protein [Aminobacter sp. MSH1]|uniref:glutathione S-transferase family protein n=1 Tax=Aminobacter sp. MSH1 TaxID=374606 RepID=UPI000D398A9E|nr:glutathione S-transferase family protein [Aminobacter sp. MSH1]
MTEATATPPAEIQMFWSSRSPYCRKVMIVAHELAIVDRLRIERVVVGSAIPNARVMGYNPLNKIPTIVVPDGRVYFDSPVIAELFDMWYGQSTLFPRDVMERQRAIRWQALGDGFMDLLIQLLAESTRPVELRSSKHLESYNLKIATVIDGLQAEAAELAAVGFGIGHISIGCALGHLDFRFGHIAWKEDHPQLAAWYADFLRRPSAQATEYQDRYI